MNALERFKPAFASLKRPSVLLRLISFIFILSYIVSMYSDRIIGGDRYSKRFNNNEIRMHPYYKDDVNLETLTIYQNLARRFKHNGSLSFIVDKNESLKDRDGVIMQVFADDKLIAEQAENPYLYQGASKPAIAKFKIPRGTQTLKIHLLQGKNHWNDGTRVFNLDINRANPFPTILFWLCVIVLFYPSAYYRPKTWLSGLKTLAINIKNAFIPAITSNGGGGGKARLSKRRLCRNLYFARTTPAFS
ncbi:MAG: hypothetical protein LBP89_04150 [Helicobacteraceae bacterium]|jgi:hypothetical protein|nr:hypothetical protein [Helicobacteraceae bacterium]